MLIRRATEALDSGFSDRADFAALILCSIFLFGFCCTLVYCAACSGKKRKNVQGRIGTSNVLPFAATTGAATQHYCYTACAEFFHMMRLLQYCFSLLQYSLQ